MDEESDSVLPFWLRVVVFENVMLGGRVTLLMTMRQRLGKWWRSFWHTDTSVFQSRYFSSSNFLWPEIFKCLYCLIHC